MNPFTLLSFSTLILMGCSSSNKDQSTSGELAASSENTAVAMTSSPNIDTSSDNIAEFDEPTMMSESFVGSSTCGFLPSPLAEEFFNDDTAFVEISIFRKAMGEPGSLVDTIQYDPNLNNPNVEGWFLEFNSSASIPFGLAAPNGCDLLGEFRQCEIELEPQDFNVVVVATSTNGDNVRLVNTDYCGINGDFEFNEIHGEVDVNTLASLLFELEYPFFDQLLVR